MQRRLSLTAGSSDKFWHIDVVGAVVTVHYGRRGTRGQTSTKTYADAEEAERAATRQVAGKIAKGYVDDDSDAAGQDAPVPVVVAPTPEPAQPHEQAPAADPGSAPAPTPTAPATTDQPPTPASACDPDDPYDIGLPTLGPFDLALRREADVRAEVDDAPFDLAAAQAARRGIRVAGGAWHPRAFATPTPLGAVPTGDALAWWRTEATDVHRSTLSRSYAGRESFVTRGHPGLAVALDVCRLGVDEFLRSLPGRPVAQVLAARAVLHLATPGVLDELRAKAVERPEGPDSTGTAAVLRMALDGTQPDVEDLLELRPGRWNPSVSPLFLLPTPQERGAAADELELRITGWDPEMLYPWVVATGSAGFGTVVRSVAALAATEAKGFVDELSRFLDGAGAVPLFVDLLDTKAAPGALAWLSTHLPQLMAARLTPEQAERLLPLLRGLDDATLAVMADKPSLAAVARQVRGDRDTPTFDPATDWWQQAAQASTSRAPRLPGGVAVTACTPLRIDDAVLAPEEMTALLGALQHDPAASPLVAAVKANVREAQRDDFVLALLDLWLSVSGPAKQIWMMTGPAHLGGERTVTRLAGYLRRWPLENQHGRAKHGVAALANTGSDQAIAELVRIVEGKGFPALRTAAREQLEVAASLRGLTRGQLEDRIVPRADLDDRGTRTFDMGSRRFQGVVGADGKLVLRLLDDGRPTGTPRTSLPAPVKADDPDLAAAAAAQVSATKKALAAIAKSQRVRYEAAMVSGRRWTPTDHRQFIAEHPVLRRLLAGVVWGLYDGDHLAATARIDEDGSLVDADDEPVPADGLLLGVVHPVDLSSEQAGTWAAVMSDYELVAPFPQLTRPVFAPEDLGPDALALPGLPTRDVAATAVLRALTRYGWERGAPEDGGVVHAYALPHEASGLTAVAYLSDGISLGWSPTEQNDQGIEAVDLVDGVRPASDFGYRWASESEDRISWSRAPRALVSEVLATLHDLEGR